jgi:hypothetical protein
VVKKVHADTGILDEEKMNLRVRGIFVIFMLEGIKIKGSLNWRKKHRRRFL